VRRTIALLPLALVLAAGCGGDDSTETVTVGATATAEPLTKAEYIERSDAICAESQEISDELDSEIEAARTNDYDALADAIEKALDDIQPLLDEWTALPKPEGDEGVLEEIERLRAQGLALLERFADAMREEDLSRMRVLRDEIDSLGVQVDGIETGYGFKVCGQGD
jgi:hypothetical protein